MSSQSRRGLGRVFVMLAVLAGLTLMAAPATAATTGPAIPAPTFTSARATAIVNMPVTFTFRQTKGANNRPTPTGTVTISDGTTTLATLPLGATGATTYTAGFAEGTHTLTATYTGDATYPEATATAAPLVVEKGSTYNTLESTKVVVGTARPARFSSRAYRNSNWTGSLAGTTRFIATAPGQTTVTADVGFSNATGVATWTPTLADGTWSITATYFGNQSWTGSTSPTITQLVGPPTGPAPVDVDNRNALPNQQAWFTGDFTRVGGSGYLEVAQTFTAGRTGSLTALDLQLDDPFYAQAYGNPAYAGFGTFDVAIVALDAGVPAAFTSTPIGGATDLTVTPGPATYTLTTAAPVVAGTSYAIVITAPDAGAFHLVESDPSDGYAGGQGYQFINGGWVTLADFRFATRVA